ncbi:hypothetical protein PHYSODRAFT_245883 [Phytophthora sojae]|uniref:Uncharacterized protein n=1 Tax=Phytophthora sojae (strain P6497) TaxID=1094619 RepID=G4Z7I7_PHYSP|nr:hypothetical protein PHYSODRAFT_245883 [Phytophthora sojae]EGZ20390.1 hypothetical protein PHYSODRAFT_245883 [Phytophthora sojae]|eukprot:XP_009523107.1 hypothetical protein PHYSODRAFT_245883 [Phytophthora sojae]
MYAALGIEKDDDEDEDFVLDEEDEEDNGDEEAEDCYQEEEDEEEVDDDEESNSDEEEGDEDEEKASDDEQEADDDGESSTEDEAEADTALAKCKLSAGDEAQSFAKKRKAELQLHESVDADSAPRLSKRNKQYIPRKRSSKHLDELREINEEREEIINPVPPFTQRLSRVGASSAHT